MISVADLLSRKQLPDNYFSPRHYVQSDLELGVLENRRGNRLISVPETLIKALYAGLEQETGLAARLVLYNCGRWWGKNFFGRFSEDLADYYGRPLTELPMAEFVQLLRQCWTTHGWGQFDLDPTYTPQGFLVVSTQYSPFATQAPRLDRPVCFLDAGILSAFFSQLTGQELYCVQISCESLGADLNRFVLGLESRLAIAEDMLDSRQDYGAILNALAA
jgi:uncharacterized protein